MPRQLIYLLPLLPLLFLFCSALFTNAEKGISHLSPALERTLEISEEKIDFGVAALTFAKEIYPDINITLYLEKIDELAKKVHLLSRGTKDPDYRIRCLNTVMFLHENFKGTRDLSNARESGKYFLNRVLDTKQGNCVSMPFLYIAISQRLGWPIHLVHVPDHSFVRYVDPTLKEQNIEPTSNGGYVSDEKYAKDFLVSEKGRRTGAYLRTLTYTETLSDLAVINGITFGWQGQAEKSVAYLELATRLNSRNVAAWGNLINAYRILAKQTNKSEAVKYFELAAQCSKKLDELGFVHPKNIPQISSPRRS